MSCCGPCFSVRFPTLSTNSFDCCTSRWQSCHLRVPFCSWYTIRQTVTPISEDSYSTLHSRILIIRTPKQGTPSVRKPLFYTLKLSDGTNPGASSPAAGSLLEVGAGAVVGCTKLDTSMSFQELGVPYFGVLKIRILLGH